MTSKVNGKTEILTPCRSETETPQNIEAKLGVIDYVMDPYNLANFCENRSKGVCSPNHSLSSSYTTCCISDVSSQWEGATLTPCSSEIRGAIDPKLKTKKHVLGPPHTPNMVKIGLGVWAGPIPSLSPHLGYPLSVFTARQHT